MPEPASTPPKASARGPCELRISEQPRDQYGFRLKIWAIRANKKEQCGVLGRLVTISGQLTTSPAFFACTRHRRWLRMQGYVVTAPGSGLVCSEKERRDALIAQAHEEIAASKCTQRLAHAARQRTPAVGGRQARLGNETKR